jgi:hypothetical protein
MRIQILDRAERDLIEGFHFYESQGVGLGSYFLANLDADIESLHIYAGIHSKPLQELPSPAVATISFRGFLQDARRDGFHPRGS